MLSLYLGSNGKFAYRNKLITQDFFFHCIHNAWKQNRQCFSLRRDYKYIHANTNDRRRHQVVYRCEIVTNKVHGSTIEPESISNFNVCWWIFIVLEK